MEEPKKVLKAQYLGSMEVPQATGMEVLNLAIDTMMEASRVDQWENVNVSVAPSMISVHASGDDPRLLAECRVRYLSFLGIGKNVKNCAFIMHTAQDKFIAHVFQCEPSSGALCKTVEAACKVSIHSIDLFVVVVGLLGGLQQYSECHLNRRTFNLKRNFIGVLLQML